MSDGAHQGVGAERALGTILGGQDQPRTDEKVTPEEMKARILAAPEVPNSYDEASLTYARICLEAIAAFPRLKDQPVEAVYLTDTDDRMAEVNGSYPKLVPSFYDVLLQIHSDEDCWQRRAMSGLSGFMVGWAHNAVRYALGLPPVPNPAILEIG